MNSTLQTMYLSKKGLKDLKKQITKLEHDRQLAANQLRELNKSETDDSQFQRSEKLGLLESLDAEIFEKKELLRHAKPLPRKRDALKVALGSVVELIDTNGRVIRYTVVESVEADPSEGRISVLSPLGQTLIGKTIKDTIEWGTGIKRYSLQLVQIK